MNVRMFFISLRSREETKRRAHSSLQPIVLAAGALALLAGGGCSRRYPAPNIVLVVVDSLRADALGCYGVESSPSPNIDRIAAAGLRFEHALTQAPWNIPAISSLVTSNWPHEHGQGDVNAKATPNVTTLAEALAAQGYATAAFVEVKSWPLLERGFTRIVNTATPLLYGDPQKNAAERTIDAAKAWIPGPDHGPFFVLIHTYETHNYFMSKTAYRAFAKRERPEYSGRFFDWSVRETDAAVGPQVMEALLAASAEDVAFVRSLYRGAISETDAAIGRLDAVLGKLDRETVLVVTASNGEGFRPDLKRVHHAGRLHDDLLRVPLIVRWPGRIEPGVKRSLVASIDIAPTLLELAGAAPESRFRGRSLLLRRESALPLFGRMRFEPADLPSRSVFAEESAMRVLPSGERGSSVARQVAVYAEGVKLIDNGESVELYDLKNDPSEERNVAVAHPDAVAKLCSQIESFLKDSGRADPGADTTDQLVSLGYLSKDPQARRTTNAQPSRDFVTGCERATADY